MVPITDVRLLNALTIDPDVAALTVPGTTRLLSARR
jgi:hypothetical protein